MIIISLNAYLCTLVSALKIYAQSDLMFNIFLQPVYKDCENISLIQLSIRKNG